ncbi:hypothetical protein GCM10011571_09340 [Marinithermofilum abyssi]|uniref:Uncharacterized protein n=1 Tax=Marinithermofilum abyssi TaxID=1571185 RepID=A0A8J2VGL5_9BACL|nr:hypothetical protein [Marinithermofilum abyssi]GGE10164.1 hypothetical protein GCM10011571_09340 [Marinithermofilum abyssi]
MKMKNQHPSVWRFILYGLMVVGFLRLLFLQPAYSLTMLGVGAVIIYLYKRPPRWLIRFSYPGSSIPPKPLKKGTKFKGRQKKYAKKRQSFRVIEGNKKGPGRNTKTQ